MEVLRKASDFGISSDRIAELDFRLLCQQIIIVENDNEITKKEEEMKTTEGLNKAYEILQDFNQYEISYYVKTIIGATLDRDIRRKITLGRVEHIKKKLNEATDRNEIGKLTQMAVVLASNEIGGIVGGLFGGLFGGMFE